MSDSDRYFTVPLSILRSGDSALAVLEACIAVGMVNAGIGYRKTHDDEEFLALLEEADEAAKKQGLPTEPPSGFKLQDAKGGMMPCFKSFYLWKDAHAGAQLLKIRGGNRAKDAQTWASHYQEGEVFFRIKSDWLGRAFYSARRDAGQLIESDYKPISWREFRILAAILSSKPNSYQFTFLGWEFIQARACGFHSKELFSNGKIALPNHCQPLTRQMIRDACDKLEPLGFFARCRYSGGKSGGLTAYSFRHPKRENLQDAVLQWQTANSSLKAKRDAHRSSDLKAFKRTK